LRSIPGKCELSSFGNYTNKKLHFKKDLRKTV
jgi:hypothetical protein